MKCVYFLNHSCFSIAKTALHTTITYIIPIATLSQLSPAIVFIGGSSKHGLRRLRVNIESHEQYSKSAHFVRRLCFEIGVLPGEGINVLCKYDII